LPEAVTAAAAVAAAAAAAEVKYLQLCEWLQACAVHLQQNISNVDFSVLVNLHAAMHGKLTW
jgi:hypothetical protein